MTVELFALVSSSGMKIGFVGNGEYETDRYQVTAVSTWSWARYADYVRSRMGTFEGNITDVALIKYPEQVRAFRLSMVILTV